MAPGGVLGSEVAVMYADGMRRASYLRLRLLHFAACFALASLVFADPASGR